jgi:membrane associated rhomboid family serine protease
MIPIRDSNPSYTFPIVVVSLILTNVLVYLYEMGMPQDQMEPFFRTYGLVAREFAFAAGLKDRVVPVVTSMFLHGGFLHLLGNMWFLWVFGDNVEDRIGHGRFLLLYFVSGVCAALLQVAINPYDATPIVGASGAIAGVLGAYLVMFPHASVLTIVPVFIFLTFVNIPASTFLILWFAMQFLYGMGSFMAKAGSIAWWAHVGGFATGVVLAFLIPKKRRRLEQFRRVHL